LVDDNSDLNYCLYIIAAIITPVMFMLNPFITYAVYEQDSYSCTICIDISNNILISEMQNGNSLNSYFTSLFSDLSRNMTSPPPSSSLDPFEDSNVNTGLQDNVDTDTEVNGLQEEDTTDTTSDLFEDSSVNTGLQDNIENNNTEIDQQDESTTATELQENNDNNSTSG
jgi:hypothetical protein